VLLDLLFAPEDGGDIFLRNVEISANYAALQPQTHLLHNLVTHGTLLYIIVEAAKLVNQEREGNLAPAHRYVMRCPLPTKHKFLEFESGGVRAAPSVSAACVGPSTGETVDPRPWARPASCTGLVYLQASCSSTRLSV
jgi:hypothetical protein